MRYSKLFHLKYIRGLSTHELMEQYPGDTQRISEIALLELDEAILQEVLTERKIASHLKQLKKKFPLPDLPHGAPADLSRKFPKRQEETSHV